LFPSFNIKLRAFAKECAKKKDWKRENHKSAKIIVAFCPGKILSVPYHGFSSISSINP